MILDQVDDVAAGKIPMAPRLISEAALSGKGPKSGAKLRHQSSATTRTIFSIN